MRIFLVATVNALLTLSSHACNEHLTGTVDERILVKGGRFMSNTFACAFATLAAVAGLALPANAQSVISTRSGVIYFFQGAVYLGDQALESYPGKFPCVPKGGELRTADGRAEVLLTPGVFLRMGERSAIRLVANDLADTQVELKTGSAIVDSGEPNSGTSVTVIYKDWRVHLVQKGSYRIDSDPPRLQVRQGEAQVSTGPAGQPISVETGMSLPFAGVLVPERSIGEPGDALSDWSSGRSASISADDAITAQLDEDPPSGVPGLDGFTYFPFLGVSLGSSSLYSSYTPSQPGFNSIYLPGYTYLPLLLGIGGRRLQTYGPLSPGGRIGFSPGAGGITPFPRAPIVRAPVVRPAPIHVPPPIAVHGVGRR